MSPSFCRVSILIVLITGLVVGGCTTSSPARRSEDGDDETVHTGYGDQKKRTSTTSTSSVTPTQSNQDRATTLQDLLRGQTAGVRVERTGAGVRVRIRGVTSINADTTPLYVLDGMTIEPGAYGTVPVDPRDVKSITILKDAAATSIYGSRGANGVIVIETKDQ